MLSHVSLSAALGDIGVVPIVEVWKLRLERWRNVPKAKASSVGLERCRALTSKGCANHHPTCLSALWFSGSRNHVFPSWALNWEAQQTLQDSRLEASQWLSDSQNHLAETQSLQPLCGIFPFRRLSLNVGMMGKSTWLIKVLFIKAGEISFLSWRKRWRCSRSRYLYSSFKNTECSKNKIYWNKHPPEELVRCQL